ncbi:MAG: hypothetical protein P0Y49_10925 [Candidatus Pedobacter colombiensis]|uniref:Uncharacterized protein n=1 Tax=Candidatus Pedobacter colombiensis TaxID=3121371 RepID=A0AAJ6B971_9SPHI|nr:hypothetical protein [Pedobacter sp.]WEK21649.1 MAG: hypothetical protein P0Y49_10925 [Pedobacter sp.]
MDIQQKTALTLFSDLVADLGNVNEQLSTTFSQQLFLVRQLLINDILTIKQNHEKVSVNEAFKTINNSLSEIETKTTQELIPTFEHLGDKEKLGKAKEIIEAVTFIKSLLKDEVLGK